MIHHACCGFNDSAKITAFGIKVYIDSAGQTVYIISTYTLILYFQILEAFCTT